MSRKPLIAGNWKMNLNHAEAVTLVQKLAWTLDDANFNFSATEVAVFPPFTDIRSVQTLVEGDKLDILYGGQDLSVHAPAQLGKLGPSLRLRQNLQPTQLPDHAGFHLIGFHSVPPSSCFGYSFRRPYRKML